MGWLRDLPQDLRYAIRMLRRSLEPSDDANPNVVVISFETWQQRFHSDPHIVGTAVEFLADFNASATPERERPRLLTIVGVLPAGFELPTGAMDYYMPFV